jgi:hypothetical protein
MADYTLRNVYKKAKEAILSPSSPKPDEPKDIVFSVFDVEDKIAKRKKRIKEQMPED